LKGKPFVPYPPFEVLYDSEQPLTTVIKAGRQVSKTTSMVVQHILQATSIPYFNILCVSPRELQAAKVSTLFLKTILEESPIGKLFPSIRDQTKHFTFTNNSNIILSHAYLEADRVRTITADKLHIDEIQDMNPRHLPTIENVLAASTWNLTFYTGTPKTENNLLHYLWLNSSQAEWCTRCEACNRWNIPAVEFDLLKMLGPWTEDISLTRPATICAHCQRPLDQRKGQWVHRKPERRWTNAGYHIPQPILALHYADPVKWSILLSKQEGQGYTSVEDFYMEVLGEAAGMADNLVSLSDLQKVAELGDRTDEENVQKILETYPYVRKAFGIDWGGGGKEGNFTTIALCCLLPDGVIHVPWGISLRTPHHHEKEAREILGFANKFRPDFIAHDYSGAGSLRETILVASKYPRERIMPMRYVGSNEGVACRYVPPSNYHPRACYHIDPSRCLLLTCGAIKFRKIRFFNDDFKGSENPGLLRQFMSLIDEAARQGAVERYRVVCAPGQRDEFAQAVMLGCVGLWYHSQRWPSFEV